MSGDKITVRMEGEGPGYGVEELTGWELDVLGVAVMWTVAFAELYPAVDKLVSMFNEFADGRGEIQVDGDGVRYHSETLDRGVWRNRGLSGLGQRKRNLLN